jgi:hypothetical protein
VAVSEVAPREYLHRPDAGNGVGVVLSHGAGSNANAPLLVSLAEAMAEAGYLALRIDLAFRRAGRPPLPATAGADRAGIREAAGRLRELGASRVVLAGHSYGGRQSSILAAEDPEVADGLLLLSYPLHPPHKPEQMRTAHFAGLRTPAVFLHGSRDPFGSIAEMEEALRLIPAWTRLVEVARAGHDLKNREIAEMAVRELAGLMSVACGRRTV